MTNFFFSYNTRHIVESGLEDYDRLSTYKVSRESLINETEKYLNYANLKLITDTISFYVDGNQNIIATGFATKDKRHTEDYSES